MVGTSYFAWISKGEDDDNSTIRFDHGGDEGGDIQGCGSMIGVEEP